MGISLIQKKKYDIHSKIDIVYRLFLHLLQYNIQIQLLAKFLF